MADDHYKIGRKMSTHALVVKGEKETNKINIRVRVHYIQEKKTHYPQIPSRNVDIPFSAFWVRNQFNSNYR